MGRAASAWVHANRNVWSYGPAVLDVIERHTGYRRGLRRTVRTAGRPGAGAFRRRALVGQERDRPGRAELGAGHRALTGSPLPACPWPGWPWRSRCPTWTGRSSTSCRTRWTRRRYPAAGSGSGSRAGSTSGFLLERTTDSEHQGKLGYLERVVSPEPVLSPEIAGLARAVADRYGGTLADVLRLAIPPRHAAAEASPRRARSGASRVGRGRVGRGRWPWPGWPRPGRPAWWRARAGDLAALRGGRVIPVRAGCRSQPAGGLVRAARPALAR